MLLSPHPPSQQTYNSYPPYLILKEKTWYLFKLLHCVEFTINDLNTQDQITLQICDISVIWPKCRSSDSHQAHIINRWVVNVRTEGVSTSDR